MSLPIEERRLRERSTPRYEASVVDEDSVGVSHERFDYLTLTLWDNATGRIINNRFKQNVLNANGVTIDISGNLVWKMQQADTVIVGPKTLGGTEEKHTARFAWGWDGDKHGANEIEFLVENDSHPPGTVEMIIGDSWKLYLPDLGDISTRTSIWFTLKRFKTQKDISSLIQITAAGLIVVNGRTHGTAADGTITVIDATNGDISLELKPAVTALLPELEAAYADVQVKLASGEVKTLIDGQIKIVRDVTWSV
jgi:hypothetical protein